MTDGEDAQQRSPALQDVHEILARQRAKHAVLQQRNEELTHSLEAMRVTLNCIADGVLISDANLRIIDYNERYRQMWQLPPELLATRDHEAVLERVSKQFADPAAFLNRVREILRSGAAETFDVLTLTDGTVYQRYSQIQSAAGRTIGRVWSFRDVTQLAQSERTLREETRTLELLLATGTAIVSQRDLREVIQTVTDAATQLCHADVGAFFVDTDAADGGFVIRAYSGQDAQVLEEFPLPQASTLFAERGPKPILRCDDVLAMRDPAKAPLSFDAPQTPRVRSYLAVPVTSRSGVIGGLLIGNRAPRVFTPRDELLLKGIAVPAAVAIDNTRLLQRSEQAQQQLQEFNEVLEVRIEERTAQLRKSELQFQQLVAGVTDYAIYMLDPQGNVVSWNPGAERIKGYAGSEVIGHNFARFYTNEDRANGRPQMALQTAERTGKFEGEGWRQRKDGTRFWASVLIDPIRDPAGNLIGFAKVTRDMTQHRAMQEQLHQSQKMEAIGHLTGGVAHDFNNLLTVIMGNLDAIWRQVPIENSRLRRAVQQASRGAQRAAKLTQQLLAFARRQPLNPKPTDVNRLVADMSDLLRHTLGENIAIETVLAGGLWHVDVDPHQLESALLNLAVNSRDAMAEGGKLTIETANAHLDDVYAGRFAEINPGQYVVICITDTGTGMPREVMERAFDPFYTTKPIGQGTGLGLSQVYGFVKQSGGHIKLYSEMGQGTTVKIYLPRLASEAVDEEQPRASIIPQGQVSETILVVEDDEDVRAFSTETLRELGFTVLEAANASSALRMLDSHPEIRLLFTDVGLPGANGRQLADEAQQLRRTLKVLFTSGYARNAIVHQGRLEPGVELLTKPFTRAQLATRIREILDSPLPARAVNLVLLVDDESHAGSVDAEAIQELGFNIARVASAAGALSAVQAREFRLALINVDWPDHDGMDLAAELKKWRPALHVIVASDMLTAGTEVNGVLQVSRPVDRATLRNALRAAGLEPTTCT